MAEDVFLNVFSHLNKVNTDLSTSILLPNNQQLQIALEFFYTNFEPCKRKIAFVDGGNGELICAPNFSLQFIRVYGSIFENGKITKRELLEFYATVVAVKKENKIVYETKTFNSDFEINLDFDLNDATLASSNHAVSPSSVGEALRKFAELKMALKICKQLDSCDLLVRDGELCARISFEQKFLDELFSFAKSKSIILCGFSKTTTLLTDTGNSAAAVLSRLNKNGPWYYFAPQNNEIKIGFAKLAKKTNYVFRIDLFNAGSVSQIFGLLLENSKDPAFLGYPYGLIDADSRAHVSKQECAMLKLHFATRFGEQFKMHSSAIDAHDVLNLIH